VSNFIKDSDLPWVVQGFSTHPDPQAWRDWVIAHTTDLDVVDTVNELGAVGSPTLMAEAVEELRRIADTDAEVEFLRTDENGTPGPVTFSAKARGFIT